ncbi:MAG: hypothetical protein JWQ38_2081 [Flavipsychrobacter sp.]|nr:hypothetical protein [Flavipsychrobacter sp.]
MKIYTRLVLIITILWSSVTCSFAAFPVRHAAYTGAEIAITKTHYKDKKFDSHKEPGASLPFFKTWQDYGPEDGYVSGVLALVFGIMSIVINIWGIGLIFAVPGIIFGIVGTCKQNKRAFAGLICSGIGLLLVLLWMSVHLFIFAF